MVSFYEPPQEDDEQKNTGDRQDYPSGHHGGKELFSLGRVRLLYQKGNIIIKYKMQIKRTVKTYGEINGCIQDKKRLENLPGHFRGDD